MKVCFRLLAPALSAVIVSLMAATPALAIASARVARLYVTNDSYCSLIGEGYGGTMPLEWIDDPTDVIAANSSGEGIVTTTASRLDANAVYRITCGGSDAGTITWYMHDNVNAQEVSSTYDLEGNGFLCVSKDISGDSEARSFSFTLRDC
ncbi:hypothetical protein Aph02nite_44900 [Actinoplanes philippinensis]|uniref:Ig-like domain-containing protein n=1 Tax=Actinoplanes philippinensis TaxID=35752 RepID=A0A1I2I749_9ACTN|nr:hypothetical protein [Actinoplanes philippinensis]GIE78540.1 hypothetical protein Aph02nite_44900 [Actinoplanes philippinensis]SFF38145.1 hypothetical protein SAMN05421541_109387 [Actinoplanes philippinensis]